MKINEKNMMHSVICLLNGARCGDCPLYRYNGRVISCGTTIETTLSDKEIIEIIAKLSRRGFDFRDILNKEYNTIKRIIEAHPDFLQEKVM